MQVWNSRYLFLCADSDGTKSQTIIKRFELNTTRNMEPINMGDVMEPFGDGYGYLCRFLNVANSSFVQVLLFEWATETSFYAEVNYLALTSNVLKLAYLGSQLQSANVYHAKFFNPS